jgi:hypothetical protein
LKEQYPLHLLLSVSRTGDQMKHSWEEKLDEKGLKFVELSARLHKIKPPSNLGPSESRRWIKEQVDVFSCYPELDPKRKVNLDPEFVRLLQRTHPDCELTEGETIALFEREEFPLLRADELEMHQRIFLALESNQNRRFKLYGALASAIVLLRMLFSGGLLKRQLGAKTPSPFEFRKAMAQNFEWFGNSLRGELKEPPGRVNVARAGLVNKLLEHQKEPLTQVELYDALKAAGADLPDDSEAFRLWLHRARKDGLVNDSRTCQEDSADSPEEINKLEKEDKTKT